MPLDERRAALYVDGVTMDGPCWGGRGEGPRFGVGVSCLSGSQFGRSMVVGMVGVMRVLGGGLGRSVTTNIINNPSNILEST